MLMGAFWTDAWQDPAMRHAMFIHFPIVLACLLALIALIAAIAWGKWRRGLAVICLIGYGLLTISALFAQNAGSDAHEAVEGSAGKAVDALIAAHGEAASRIWWLSLCVGAVLVVSFFGSRLWQRCWRWGFTLLAICLAAYVGWTADLGGHLVYTDGVGMPQAAIDRAVRIQAGAQPSDQKAGRSAVVAANDPRAVFFAEKVRPVLSANCWKCHNTTDDDPAGGLDLTSISGVLKGGDGGPVVLIGNPEQSKLIQVVQWKIADMHMPPKKPKLPQEEIDAMVKWVQQGVVWKDE